VSHNHGLGDRDDEGERPLTTHPAADLFPLLEGPEYRALVESIRTDGLLQPVWRTPDGQTLDGRNRLRACEETNVEPTFTTYVGDDPWSFVVAANIHRRHLTPDQRASLALQLLPELKREHPQGKKTSSKEDVCSNAARAARLVGVSRSTVERVIRVESGAPDLAAKVRAGQMTFSRADRILRGREVEKLLPREPVTAEVREGDFRKVLVDLHNVDAIITDPPYAQAALPLLGDLAVWADKVLAPSGVLAVMVGIMFLPDVLRQLEGYRPYRWTMAVVGTRIQASHARKVAQQWKPILIYGSGPRINDVIRYETSEHVKHHEHGQDSAVFAQLIERLTKPGSLVVDPFAGSGTTLVAAQLTGRRSIGCDVDPAAVSTARGRLH
jgi:ParB-like chromosome segregation protein Spo0J